MKVFRLSDGTEFQVNNESEKYLISLTCETPDAKLLMDKLTPANLKTATIGEDSMSNMIYENFNASPVKEATGEVNITLYFREKTEMEIIEQRLDEQDNALMELAELIGG